MEPTINKPLPLVIMGVIAVNVMVFGCFYLSYNLVKKKERIDVLKSEMEGFRSALRREEAALAACNDRRERVGRQNQELAEELGHLDEERDELELKHNRLVVESAKKDENIRLLKEQQNNLNLEYQRIRDELEKLGRAAMVQ